MPTDLREYYRVLELSPGASLEEIKRAYRQLLQRWHPDRYKPGSVMQTTAEDVTKELNEAYNQLCRKKRYLEFRPKPKPARGPVKTGTTGEPWKRTARHGWKVYEDAAPPRREPRENPRPSPPPNPPPPSPPPRSAAPPPQAKPPEPVPEKPRTRRKGLGPWRAFAVAGLVATTMFFFARWLEALAASETPLPTFTVRPRNVSAIRPTVATATTPTRMPAPAPAPPAPVARATEVTYPELTVSAPAEVWRAEFVPTRLQQWSPSSLAGVFALPEPADREASPVRFMRRKTEAKFKTEEAWSLLDTFAPGDSKARVLAVQGEPDEAGVNVFRYGSSLVYFEEGRVTHWSEGRPALHVLVLPHFEFNGLARFGVGSTRSEVTRVQGEPTQTTANAFYYGASAVYFDRDWVTGWSEVDQPLRARPTVNLAAMLASPLPSAGLR